MIDVAAIIVKAGDGGNGSAAFRREKYVPKGGPDGGDGGDGGSVMFVGNPHMRTLDYFAHKEKFEADNGEHGQKKKMFGKKANDLRLEVPLGTVVYTFDIPSEIVVYRRDLFALLNARKDNLELWPDRDQPVKNMVVETEAGNMTIKVTWFGETVVAGDELLVARGGKGGRGNDKLKSSTNTTPKVAEPGEPGERHWVILELKLLADVGLVGLPNAGKSTLLSVITRAQPKIADYPFTTLEPNLGVLKVPVVGEGRERELVIADIPGLIEGAAEGKGLGDEFLRHIERCKVLVHLVAIDLTSIKQNTGEPAEENSGQQIVEQLYSDFEVINKELGGYHPDMLKKPQIVVVNKTDLIDRSQESEVRSQVEKYFRKHGVKDVLFISAATNQGIEELKKELGARS